jgi:hypothetical protein
MRLTPQRPAQPDDAGDEGRGDPAPDSADARPATAKTTRSRRQKPAGKTKARNLHLTDDIHDHLWLLARKKRISISAAAMDILDRNLPRLRIESD